jgi:hypothetical protein
MTTGMTGWLDRLPTWARDLLLMLVAAIAAWMASDVVPGMAGRGGVAAVLAPLLVVGLNAVTTLTRAYGRGRTYDPEAPTPHTP